MYQTRKVYLCQRYQFWYLILELFRQCCIFCFSFLLFYEMYKKYKDVNEHERLSNFPPSKNTLVLSWSHHNNKIQRFSSRARCSLRTIHFSNGNECSTVWRLWPLEGYYRNSPCVLNLIDVLFYRLYYIRNTAHVLQETGSVLFVFLFVFVLCLVLLQILPVSLDNLFLAAPSGFSNVYLQLETNYY